MVKHGGFSVMVWGAIWSEGSSDLKKCDGNINSAKYVLILQEGILTIFSSGKINKFDSLFMEDRAPYHSARATQNLRQTGINKLPWPS